MVTKIRQAVRTGAALALVVVFLAASLLRVYHAVAAPGRTLAAATQTAALPAETCTYDEGTNTRTCEFWATTGTLSLPDGTEVTIWGYTDSGATTASLPGPPIIANEGEILAVTLHNNLSEPTAMVFSGQAMQPDLDGIAAGGTTTYSFLATDPGTYLYEAGLLPNAQHQVALGLFGALIVRPALGTEYAYDEATLFDYEALVILSEIDPALNESADPAAFDLRDYAPKYFLINGQVYPDTELITTTASSQLLLRIINAGVVQHSMGTLGVDQQILALDGSPRLYPYRVAAASIGPGQTSDRMVAVPASAGTAGDSRYALYDTSLLLHNNGADGFGGMLTFIVVTDGTPPVIGPKTTSVALTPNPTDGSQDVVLTATIPGATDAEYFISTLDPDGTGIPMSEGGGADEWTATLSVADLDGLNSGDHIFYVHGSDGIAWGPFNFDVLHLDKLGPISSGLTLTPNPSNGSVAVAVSATANDTATGNSNIAAAEYFINSAGTDGTGTPMTVNVTAPIASLDGTIDVATMEALPEGNHSVYVHSMDAFGWWGDYVTATLVVDQTGPATTNVTVAPNPNNGALPYNPTRHAVRVDATVTDTSSAIKQVEGFIGTVGADGQGFPLTPRDGLFNELAEEAYAYIPLSTINALEEGIHPIWVHGQDASGNWGPATSVDLIIDKTTPNEIFADSFASGDTSAWSAEFGAVSVIPAAAMDGDGFGMAVDIGVTPDAQVARESQGSGGTAGGYVVDTTPDAEANYHARFYFNPNATLVLPGAAITLFDGQDGGSNSIFRVEYQRVSASDPTYQVRGVVLTADGEKPTKWVDIDDGATNVIEIAWTSGANVSFVLYVDGRVEDMLVEINTTPHSVYRVRLGPSGGAGLEDGASGSIHLDAFVSNRFAGIDTEAHHLWLPLTIKNGSSD